MEIENQPPDVQAGLQRLVVEARTRGCNCPVPLYLSREEIVEPEHWDRLPPENQTTVRAMLASKRPHVFAFLDHFDKCPLFVIDWSPYN